MLACSGGEFGGWTLFLKDGKFHYVHNYLKLDEFYVSSAEVVPSRQAHAERPFHADREAPEARLLHGDVTLSVDGERSGE